MQPQNGGKRRVSALKDNPFSTKLGKFDNIDSFASDLLFHQIRNLTHPGFATEIHVNAANQANPIIIAFPRYLGIASQD